MDKQGTKHMLRKKFLKTMLYVPLNHFVGTVNADFLHPTSRDAAVSIQCDPEEFAKEMCFTRLKCACGKCDDFF